VLAAAHRLRRSNEFAAAVRGGRRAGRGVLVVHLTIPDVTDNDQQSRMQWTEPDRTRSAQALTVRAGFIVSKAVGGAVTRNRVRRRLRHLVAERLAQLPAGATLVVRALPEAADSSYARLGADLDAAVAAARSPRSPRSARRRP
jgi:ribonuclease P protein component